MRAAPPPPPCKRRWPAQPNYAALGAQHVPLRPPVPIPPNLQLGPGTPSSPCSPFGLFGIVFGFCGVELRTRKSISANRFVRAFSLCFRLEIRLTWVLNGFRGLAGPAKLRSGDWRRWGFVDRTADRSLPPLVAIFQLRSCRCHIITHRRTARLKLSGVMTLFLQLITFSTTFTRIADWKRTCASLRPSNTPDQPFADTIYGRKRSL